LDICDIDEIQGNEKEQTDTMRHYASSGDAMNHIEGKNSGCNIPGCVRRLSNGERLWVCNSLASVALAARIIGDVSEEKLNAALRAVRRMHPLLGVKVVFADHSDAWLSSDNVPEPVLRIAPRRSENQWFEEIRNEYQTPFEPEKGPLIRFMLVYSPQVSELVVFAQHAICDGDALAILIRDILMCYADPAKEVKILQTLPWERYLPKEKFSLSGLIAKAFIDHCNRQWKKRPHYFAQQDLNEIHRAFWDRMQYSVALIQLEPEETSDLAARCRENGVTITSASTAAFLAAYRDIIGPFPKERRQIWIAYDLRRHLKENIGEVFALFCGVVQFKFEYDQNKSVWKNAQKIHRIIRRDVEKLKTVARELSLFDPTLIDALVNVAPFIQLFPEVFEKTENLSAFASDTKNVAIGLSHKSTSGSPGTVNTNLGRLDYPENYGNLQLDRMYFIPGASSFTPLILGGVGLKGKMVFSLNYVEELGENGSSLSRDMIQIRNRALEYLGFPDKVNDRAM